MRVLLVLLIAAVAGITGCTITKKVRLVNWAGEQRPCTFKLDGGFVLNPIDHYSANRNLKVACVQGNSLKGWIPIESAGTVPLELIDGSNAVVITNVGEITPNLSANDLLLAVNGSPVSSSEQAKQLLFGEKGSNVLLLLSRAGKQIEIEVIRQ